MRIAQMLPALVWGLAVAACADRSPAGLGPSAAPAVVAAEANPVPFTLRCETFNIASDVPDLNAPYIVHVTLDGICEGSHLGRATLHIDQTGNFAALTLVGDEILTAANGDILRIHHDGSLAPTGETSVSFGGPVSIAGGTGRFAGATGAGTFGGSADLAVNAGFYRVDAMIQYAAAEGAGRP